MSDSVDSRLAALEMLTAHQDKTIDELNTVIAQQWTVIDRLQKKLDALTGRFMALEETAAPAIEVSKPPHW
jgi:SlyX protein